MKIEKTHKIIAGFIILVAIAFLVWGCGNTNETAVTAVDSLKVDSTTLVDSVKLDTVGKK